MGFTGSAAGVLRIEGLGWSAPDLLTFFGGVFERALRRWLA